MPIRNMGTLLENIVVLEAMRVFARMTPEPPIDFVNSFAMPPLAEWRSHTTDYGFSAAQLNAIRIGQQPPLDTFQGILWSCLQQPRGQPGTFGPNGALLCRLLAHHLHCPIRLWLNDIPNGHYGDAVPALSEINVIAGRILAMSSPLMGETVVSDERWPDSLCRPAAISLADTLTRWAEPNHYRVGFLDPMRYRINNGVAGETDSTSHRQWLRLLASGDVRSAISIHFTGHNKWDVLRPELQSMHHDGVAAGYLHTLVARHSYYHVVCSIRSSDDSQTAYALAVALQQMVQAAWASWYQAIGRVPDALTVEVW